ncbi:MAG: polysaccharide biosynthesis/export family protein [Gemmatimonadales bacterium]
MTALSALRRGALALSALLAAVPLAAQERPAGDEALAHRSLASRQELEQLAARHKGGPVAALVQARLKEGDFRPGDLIRIEVQAESTLTDTFAVTRDRTLELPSPAVGSLALAGVLRSELEPRVAEFVKKFVQNSRVRAWPLMRLTIQGNVARAGIYGVPPDAPLADVLMAAGGATPDADMKKLKVERDGREIYRAQELERLIADRRTVDEAALRDGDRLVVGGRRAGSGYDSLRTVGIIVSIAGGLYGLSRAF